MTSLLHEFRKYIHPRADWSAWGPNKPARASDVILGIMLAMGCVVLVATLLTHLFATI